MRNAKYSFITTFTIAAPQQVVWNAFVDFDDWKNWWTAIQDMSVDGEDGHKNIHLMVGHGGYFLAFVLHVSSTSIDGNPEMSFVSSGDLQGAGTFIFREHDPLTTVTFYWDVTTTKKWMNRLASLLKWFFILSHGFVMREFAKGLGKKLSADVVHIENHGKKVS